MEEPTAAQMAILLAGLIASPVVVLVEAELLRRWFGALPRRRVVGALLLGAATCQLLRMLYERLGAGAALSLGPEPLELVLIAPLQEELGKAVTAALVLLGLRVRSPREGFVLGAAVGLGFAALENLFFLAQVPTLELFVRVAVERTFVSPLVHGVGTALLGAALAARRPGWGLAALAVALVWHGGSNATGLLPMTLASVWIDRAVHVLVFAGAAGVVAVARRRLPA